MTKAIAQDNTKGLPNSAAAASSVPPDRLRPL